MRVNVGDAMVSVKCNTGETLRLHELQGFQGDLKKRTKKDIEELIASIKADGLIMPLAVWLNPAGVHYLLDGHGRLAALTDMACEDQSIAEQDFPVVYIMADNEDEARKNLLQISSIYGKITRQGAVKFMATIPEYRAPSINRYMHPGKARAVNERKADKIIRISVPADKEAAVRELLSQVAYIKVLG